jgi:hypothetical protein
MKAEKLDDLAFVCLSGERTRNQAGVRKKQVAREYRFLY